MTYEKLTDEQIAERERRGQPVFTEEAMLASRRASEARRQEYLDFMATRQGAIVRALIDRCSETKH